MEDRLCMVRWSHVKDDIKRRNSLNYDANMNCNQKGSKNKEHQTENLKSSESLKFNILVNMLIKEWLLWKHCVSYQNTYSSLK